MCVSIVCVFFIMRIYKVPKDAFDNDDSDSEDASSDLDD